jgi:hypothetical protein
MNLAQRTVKSSAKDKHRKSPSSIVNIKHKHWSKFSILQSEHRDRYHEIKEMEKQNIPDSRDNKMVLTLYKAVIAKLSEEVGQEELRHCEELVMEWNMGDAPETAKQRQVNINASYSSHH